MLLKDRLDISSKRTYTDEGFLRVPAKISRTGTQVYLAMELGLTDRDPKEPVVVYRPPEEVFTEDSLNSFASKPVTDNHPPELVNAKNSKDFLVGMSGPEVIQDGDFVTTILNITDETAIKNIESGKVELSNGYTADMEFVSGFTPDGVAYDAIQRNIKGNHIAIVDRGRAGPSCRVADKQPLSGDEVNMKIIIDGVEYEVSEQVAQAVGKVQAKLADAETKLEEKDEDLKKKEDEMEEEKKKSQETNDSLQAKIDDAKSKILSDEDIDKRVAERTAFISKVQKLDSEIEWEGKSQNEIMALAVAKHCPTVNMDTANEAYIHARFDLLCEDSSQETPLDKGLKKQLKDDDNKDVDNRPADVIARENFMQDSQNAWKGGKK